MKRLVFLCLCALSLGSAAFAIEVDQNELKETGNTPIEFVNYTGPHAVIDSLQAIGEIGRSLSGAVKRGRAGDMNRYAIIHAVDSTVKIGLDADIFILGKAAQVDHINNLRVIIAAYLRGAYGYSEKDAKTLAHFITIYNAVYRGNLNTFKGKYKEIVLRHVTADKVGLAIRYDEWAGKTQIVIPLSDIKYSGTLSSIDTGSISDKKVIEKMREQDDMDIAARKDMIDLKERESEAARERADVAQKDAAEARKDADTKHKDAETTQKEADKSKIAADKSKADAAKARKEADEAAQQAKKDPKNAEAKQKAIEKKKEADEKDRESKKDDQAALAKQKEADAKRKQAEEADKKAQDKEKEATDEKQFADKKEAEAQSDRKDVAADTRKILEDKKAERKAQDEAAFASALPGAVLKVIDSNTMLSEIVLLDLKTERTLKTSALNTVRGRFLIEGPESLIAIAGAKGGNQMITLVALNPRTLEISKQAAVPIAEQSVLVQSDEGYYAVIEQDGKHYIGRFNDNLELQAKSAVTVIPYTAISVTDKGLLVQDSGNTIRLLKADTLTEALK